MSDTLCIPEVLTWDWFKNEASQRWPENTHDLPLDGCLEEASEWLRRHNLLSEALELIKEADGDRATALVHCADCGWMEKEEAIRLIKEAPGNRARALYNCAYNGWMEKEEAVRLIKEAPGDRAMALSFCAYKRWMEKDEAVRLIKEAPGCRDYALALLKSTSL